MSSNLHSATTTTSPGGSGMADAASDSLRHLVSDLNINDRTYLATDYLNHFGEVIMLLELLPDMPDMFDEVQQWRPKSYEQHFLDSGFARSDVYIRAYLESPTEFKHPFDAAVSLLEQTIDSAIKRLDTILKGASAEPLAMAVAEISAQLKTQSSLVAHIVNGEQQHSEQAAVDALFDD